MSYVLVLKCLIILGFYIGLCNKKLSLGIDLTLDLLFFCLLKLVDEFPQTIVFKSLAVSGWSANCYHVIRLVWGTIIQVEPEMKCSHVKKDAFFFFFLSCLCVSPKPSSSCTLILWTCRLVGINSSFLSAFRLLALNNGPNMVRVVKKDKNKITSDQVDTWILKKGLYDTDLYSLWGQTMFPGMRVLWSGTERQFVAVDSPSRVITLRAPPVHRLWRWRER